MPDTIGTTEAAKLLDVSPDSVSRLCRSEKFETARQLSPGGPWVISRAEVEQYAERVGELSKTDPRRGIAKGNER